MFNLINIYPYELNSGLEKIINKKAFTTRNKDRIGGSFNHRGILNSR